MIMRDGYTVGHIYWKPFKTTCSAFLSNSFHGDYFQFVVHLTLYDTRPFEHEFFHWVSQAFPLLKDLMIDNLTSQKNKYQTETVNNKQIFSKISYLHLYRLRLHLAHIDYINQFLCHTNAYVPHLHRLQIRYEKLVTVTNNFTNDATRVNCGQLKQLIFNELLVYPEHFHLYFPSLIKEFC